MNEVLYTSNTQLGKTYLGKLKTQLPDNGKLTDNKNIKTEDSYIERFLKIDQLNKLLIYKYIQVFDVLKGNLL